MIIFVPIFIAFFLVSPLIVATVLLFPYVSVAIKRKKMLRHLYKTAELCGFRVRPLHKLVCFSPNLGDRYDVIFESANKAYVIKLWSAKKPDNTLIINKNGTVCESSVVPGGLDASEKYIVTGKPKGVPVTRCNFRVKKTKQLEQVMLYYPENERIYIDRDGERTPLAEGQRIFGKVVLTPKTLEKLMRRDRAAQRGENALAGARK